MKCNNISKSHFYHQQFPLAWSTILLHNHTAPKKQMSQQLPISNLLYPENFPFEYPEKRPANGRKPNRKRRNLNKNVIQTNNNICTISISDFFSKKI